MLEQRENMKENMVVNVLKTNLCVSETFKKPNKQKINKTKKISPQNKPVDFAALWIRILENSVNL